MAAPGYSVIIAERIRAYRKENGLSLRDFGRLIGVSAQAVCKWERNACYPDIFCLPQLARILKCTTDDFFVENRGR